MKQNHQPDWYEGTGAATLAQRGLSAPDYAMFAGEEKSENHIASEGLKNAVNVALFLGQPLLLTGEPGTGKTRLAASVAWELGFPLLEFHTKTTSTAADLFYHYDAILRFQDAHGDTRKPLESYISCQALGTAILLTRPTDLARKVLPESYKTAAPTRSVVLIDEIDKASRSLPETRPRLSRPTPKTPAPRFRDCHTR